MKRRNIIILLLIIASLVVWSRNIYLIVVGLIQQDQESIEQSIKIDWDLPQSIESVIEKGDQFIYSAKTRDPFKSWIYPAVKKDTSRSMKRVSLKIEKQKPKSPEIRFGGIVSDTTGTLAVIDGPDGEVYFAHENDTLLGVQIIKIDKDSLYLQFRKQRITLPLIQ